MQRKESNNGSRERARKSGYRSESCNDRAISLAAVSSRKRRYRKAGDLWEVGFFDNAGEWIFLSAHETKREARSQARSINRTTARAIAEVDRASELQRKLQYVPGRTKEEKMARLRKNQQTGCLVMLGVGAVLFGVYGAAGEASLGVGGWLLAAFGAALIFVVMRSE